MNGEVGHMEVANLRDAYNTVDVCWRFYEDDGTTIAFGNQSGLSAQRFDATNDLSNLQEYIEIIVGGACGEAWLADNIVQGPAGGDPLEVGRAQMAAFRERLGKGDKSYCIECQKGMM